MTLAGAVVGLGIVWAIIVALDGEVAALVPAGFGVLVAASLSPLLLRRQVDQVLRANRRDT
jgi:uncharacterized membrane protein YccC